jgi:hypothetical protein
VSIQNLRAGADDTVFHLAIPDNGTSPQGGIGGLYSSTEQGHPYQ